MSIFTDVGDWVKQRIAGGPSAAIELKAQINDVRHLLEVNSTLLEKEDYRRFFVAGLGRSEAGRTPTYLTGAVYRRYLHDLSVTAEHAEDRSALSTVRHALDVGIRDLNELSRRSLDNDEGPQTLAALVTAGYIEALGELGEWIFYMLNLADEYRPDGSRSGSWFKHPPRYAKERLAEITPKVAALVSEIYARKGKHGFVSLLDEMRHSGRDLALTVDGHTIADYAHERSYGRAELDYATLGMGNPFYSIGSSAVLRRRELFRRNEAIRNWLASKAARFALDAQQVDPTSSEYARLIKLSENYADLVSEYTKKMERYAV